MKRLFVKEIAVLLVLALLIPMFSVAEDVQVNLPGGVPGATDFLEVDDLMEVELEDEATGDDLLLDGLSDELSIDEVQVTPSELDVESDAEAETEENAAKKYGVPTQLTLGVKEAFALKCTKKNLTYKSSAPKIAKVDKKGVITPLKKGKATITVFSNKKKVVTCKVTVLDAPDSITLSCKSRNMVVGSTIMLMPTLPKKTASKIKWTSSKKSVATVDDDGVVCALKKGATKITAKTFNGKKAVCKITVDDGAAYISFDTDSLSIGVREKVTLKPEVNQGAKVKYTWSSKDKKIATVSKKGVVTGLKTGSTEITVKTQNDLAATLKVTVLAAPSKVTLNKKEAELAEGATLQLKATLPKKTASQIKWSSSAKEVATVDTYGLVTAVVPGEATITAKTFNGKSATCVVKTREATAVDQAESFWDAYERAENIDVSYSDMAMPLLVPEDFDDSEEMDRLIEEYNGLVKKINENNDAFVECLGRLADALDELEDAAGETKMTAAEDGFSIQNDFLSIDVEDDVEEILANKGSSLEQALGKSVIVRSIANGEESAYALAQQSRDWVDRVSWAGTSVKAIFTEIEIRTKEQVQSMQEAYNKAVSQKNLAKSGKKGIKAAEKNVKKALKALNNWIKWRTLAKICVEEIGGFVVGISDAALNIGNDLGMAKEMYEISNHGHPINERESGDRVRSGYVSKLNESISDAEKSLRLHIGLNVGKIVAEIVMLGKGKLAKYGYKLATKLLGRTVRKKIIQLANEKWIKRCMVWVSALIDQGVSNIPQSKVGKVEHFDDILHGNIRGVISGKVLNTNTKQPIQDLLVICDDKKAYTKADGTFVISAMYGDYSGAYALRFDKPEYKETFGEVIVDEEHDQVEITIEMEPSGFFFGHYDQDNNPSNGMEPIEWIELARNGDTVTLISRYALDAKPYNNEWVDTTWATCTLRSWLNSTFLNAAFTSAEQGKIQTVRVTAEDNPYYDTEAGSDTYDKVWLLSIREAEDLFSSDAARVCYPTATAIANGCYTYGSSCWWWLRSPGELSNIAALVSHDGGVHSDSNGVDYAYGAVRPVVCLRLS